MLSIKLNKLAILLTATVLLFGCSAHHKITPPIFTAQLLKTQTDYYSEGDAEQYAATYIEFVGQEEDLFLFYVEVESISEDPITVYPAEIYLEVVEGIGNPNRIYKKRYFALDPEREIAAINRMMEEEDARYNGLVAMNLILAVFSFAADLTSETENTEETATTDVANTAMNQVNEEIIHTDLVNDLEEKKDFWKNEVLNESILNPGDTVGGLVCLPFSDNAVIFQVIIPVFALRESNLFRQVQINK